MTVNLTVDVMLQIAMELERRGRTFYESLAAGCGNARIAALAATLAKAEGEHFRTFARMREKLPESMRGPNLTEVELAAAADELRTKILPNARVVREAVMTSDFGRALDMAIAMEAEAVAVYAEVAAGLAGLDADVMGDIVNEEKEHLTMLNEVRNLSESVLSD